MDSRGFKRARFEFASSAGLYRMRHSMDCSTMPNDSFRVRPPRSFGDDSPIRDRNDRGRRLRYAPHAMTQAWVVSFHSKGCNVVHCFCQRVLGDGLFDLFSEPMRNEHLYTNRCRVILPTD